MNEKNERIKHSCEHVYAQAIKELYQDRVTLAVAHISEDGFANDAKWQQPISPDDLPKIEKKMQEIIKADLPIVRKEISIDEAKKLFANNPFKLEWVEQWAKQNQILTVYWTGDKYVDLCKGPHVEHTGEIKAFKLTAIAGAYWRGDEKNEMLTRVYGVAFDSKEELNDYITRHEEAKKRDHRKLGKELDLFTFSDLVGSGLPLYTQKGALIRKLLNNYVEELQSKAGYMQVWTPQITKADLFKISGHYDKYKENLFKVKSNYSEEEFFLKPMNCPQHTQIYASRPRSYRDLPIRMTDFAMLYRDEKPGELNGLARVRSFSQDDCHVFCREDQVDQEVDLALSMTKKVMATFGFKYRYRLSTRDPKHPEKYIGNPDTWNKAEIWAEKIIKRNKIDYFEGPGEAAFYAPKMDLMATDALGREWQLSTIQIDYFMPEKFNLTYVDNNGTEKRPVMIHRAIIGSPERFIMILLEHFVGNFPLWLSPVQIDILSVSEKHLDYCQALTKEFQAANLRVELDSANESVGKKIRKSVKMKTPYVLVIGDQEMNSDQLSIRKRGEKETQQIDKTEFIKNTLNLIVEKSLEL